MKDIVSCYYNNFNIYTFVKMNVLIFLLMNYISCKKIIAMWSLDSTKLIHNLYNFKIQIIKPSNVLPYHLILQAKKFCSRKTNDKH